MCYIKESSFNKDSSATKRAKKYKKITTIDMYLQFNTEMDTTVFDATLSIKIDKKFN
jgi:hypothetical protein